MTHHHLWSLISQSDAISVAILLALFALSIVCWSVIFAKFWGYRQYKKQMHIVYSTLSNVRTLEQILAAEAVIERSGSGAIWRAACDAVRAQTLEKTFDPSRIQLEPVQVAIDDAYQKNVAELGGALTILNTSAEISPLLGLFGTVWGLIHSFVRISMLQSADIVTVAPGIAEALITTLAGLIVAVPALSAYHALKKTETLLLAGAEQIANRTELVITQCARKGASHVTSSHASSPDITANTPAHHPHASY